MRIEFFLNDKSCDMVVDPDEMLADALRKIGMLSIRKGCDTSCCGLCTVWVDGAAVLSCTMPAFRVEGKSVTTIEGIQSEATAFAKISGGGRRRAVWFLQSRFYYDGVAMKNELSNPTDEQFFTISPEICAVCTGYMAR